jgi:uncharacterized protein YlzI (FlbEa/FlbD family)
MQLKIKTTGFVEIEPVIFIDGKSIKHSKIFINVLQIESFKSANGHTIINMMSGKKHHTKDNFIEAVSELVTLSRIENEE